MRRARDVRNQLAAIVEQCQSRRSFPRSSRALGLEGLDEDIRHADEVTLCRYAISQCLFPHTCRHATDQPVYHLYGTDNQSTQTWLHLHPSSALAEVEPKWVVYQELVFTSKPFMRHVCAIEFKWVQTLLPKLRQADIQKLSGREILLEGTVEAEQARREAGIDTKRPTILTASRIRSAGGAFPVQQSAASRSATAAKKKAARVSAARERYLARRQAKKMGVVEVKVPGAGAMDSR